jgi:Matrixin
MPRDARTLSVSPSLLRGLTLKSLLLLFLLLSSLPAFATEPTQEEQKTLLAPFLLAPPSCPTATASCFGVVLHVVLKDGAAIQTPEWVAAQFEHANLLFAPISVGFYLKEVAPLSSDKAEIVTRSDRNALGKKRFSRGVVHLFLVEKLADVDEVGKWLNGVHWRDQGNRERRWVILASTAWALTLAHELGHFFGLPHSTYEESIMNKTPRETPAPEDRIFAEKETVIMKSQTKTMVKSKMLKNTK